MDWSRVTKDDIEKAIQQFKEERPDYTSCTYYLMYNGEKFPAKHIRGLSYSIATGEKFTVNGFSGGEDTVKFFNKYGYIVKKFDNEDRNDKYSVNDAVWIATALMAAERFSLNPDINREGMFFKQSEIVKKAQTLIKSKVNSARVSWWVNADNAKHTHNYLRADSMKNSEYRRLSMLDEFPDKTYPDGLNMSDEFEINNKKITLKELFSFVEKLYPKVINKMEKIDIDYKCILDYLDKYSGVEYEKPEKVGLSKNDKEKYSNIKKNGQVAYEELKKIADNCNILYGLNNYTATSWLYGTNKKTKDYLWLQMKYKEFEKNPISISVFVELNEAAKSRYRISLEIKNSDADEETMRKYHSHLDIQKEDGMLYVLGSNEQETPKVITDTVEEIKNKLTPMGKKKPEYSKVQLSIYVDSSPEKTNEQYNNEVMEAVGKLIPYYEHVIGKQSTTSTTVRGWLLTWNLENWDWENYKEICENTSDNNTYEEMWTCYSQKPKIGDDVFLMKVGKEPRGIIAHGYVSKEAYEGDHFDPDKAKNGEKIRRINVKFDKILDYNSEQILNQKVLVDKLSNQEWSPRQSGIKIESSVLPELKNMWDELIGVDVKMSNDKPTTDEKTEITYDKNMILYGPPGTGKTYSTTIYAVAICDNLDLDTVKNMDYNEVMKRYGELVSDGQVTFTTFHQSYGYEEFIEGIKPVVNEDTRDVGYKIEDGIFKKFCDDAKRKKIISPENLPDINNSKVWCVHLDGSGKSKLKKQCFDEGNICIGFGNLPETITFETENCSSANRRILLNFQDEMKIGDIVVTAHNNESIDGIGIVLGDYEYDNTNSDWPRKREVQWLMTEKEVKITDLNDGRKLDRKTVYPLNRVTPDKILSLVNEQTEFEIKEQTKPYVFIIDEINRGNISKIFGELITLIEDTKREGMEEQASAILPYSKQPFSVPSNVYIIGTMNTADRSIALMDTALRRRFQFVEMMPNADVLRELNANMIEDLDVAVMLEKINERITYLYDREHTIGHAFFTKIAQSPTIDTLQSIFEKSVIPLLQEYFYEDYQKIQLVLGDNGKSDDNLKFIKDEDINVRSVFKGNAEDIIDLPEKKYSINTVAFSNIDSYKQII